MDSFCRCAFIIVLSLFIWTAGLQAAEKKSVNEPIKEKIVDSLPVKPSEKIIEQKLSFNSWIDQGYEELSKKIPSLKAKGILGISLKEGGLFEVTTRDGRTLEDLDSLIKKLESMQNEEGNTYINAFVETFLPLVKDTRKKVYDFLTNNTVYENLQEDIKPDDMVGHWFWYRYMYAHDPNKVAPLFTCEFRKKIYANQYPVTGDEEFDSRNIYDFLEEFLELYYEYGIKYFKDDTTVSELIDQTFENIKSAIGPYAVRKDKHTLIFMEKEEEGGLMWKFEDSAWRFDGPVMPETIEKQSDTLSENP